MPSSATTPSTTMLSLPSPPSSSSSSSSSSSNPSRPTFNSHRTQDRLREGETPYVLFRTETSNLQRGRKSVFKETGLLDDITIPAQAITPDIVEDDSSSASGVSLLLTSPVTPPSSATGSEAKQPAPFPPLQGMSVPLQHSVRARDGLES